MNILTKHTGRKLLAVSGCFVGAVCSGALLACSFPPLEEYQSAWVALVPLIICARYCRPGRMFLWGYLSGVVFWLCSLSWLLKIAGRGTNLLGAVAGWTALALYCAVYIGLFGMMVSYLLGKISFSSESRDHGSRLWQTGSLAKIGMVLLIPVVWVGLEYIRSVLFTGFPWNLLGVTQFRNIVLIQVAELGGVYAVSFLIAVMNVSISMVVFNFIDVYAMRRPAGGIRLELFAGLLLCALCWAYGIRKAADAEDYTEDSLTLRIASIQPNVSQMQKWSELEDLSMMNLRSNTELASATKPDLIVWPETAIVTTFETDPISQNFVRDIVQAAGTALLTGAMEAEPDRTYKGDDPPGAPWNTVFYNSSYLVNSNGVIMDKYRKRHLVPFGEYLPFDKHIRFLKHIAPLGFSCDSGREPVVFELPVESEGGEKKTARFSSLICFEDAFAYLSREAVKAGARLLINQTNDAWFDGSSGAVQHMSHCVFRCVETRVPAVRCTNTGMTCLISKTGRIKKTLQPCSSGWISGGMVLPDEDMPMTVYASFGDIILALPCAIMVAAIFVLALKDIKNNRKQEENQHD